MSQEDKDKRTVLLIVVVSFLFLFFLIVALVGMFLIANYRKTPPVTIQKSEIKRINEVNPYPQGY